jgi:hypothetical protein
LGINFLKMRSWESRLTGSRISLSDYITEEANIQRPNILNWIQQQRIANDDSIAWWMTHIAGRNNMSSQFFDYLIQIAALKRWIVNNRNTKAVIICENSFVLQAVYDNLINVTHVKVRCGWLIIWFIDRLYYLLRTFKLLIKQIKWFYINAKFARNTRLDVKYPPSDEIHLVHQCLDSQSFINKEIISCRYLTSLPEWLESQGKHVIKLPWLYDDKIATVDVYKQLRHSNCLIPEDWLEISDYINAILFSFKSITAIRQDIVYKDFDIKSLVSRERFQQSGDGIHLSRFWRYGPALERWGKSLKSLTFYDTYESMPPEHIQIFVGRTKLNSITKFYGYYHSIVSRDFLGYHLPIDEDQSAIHPDLIITNGKLGRQILVSQGHDYNQIIEGPALRNINSFQINDIVESSRVHLLLALSMIPESIIELLHKIGGLAPWIRDEIGVHVLVKPHPMVSKSEILRMMKWRDLPDGWSWSDDDLNQALSKSLCAITINTASIIDVVASGCIPLALCRSLALSWNYLDHFSSEFEILQTVADDLIQTRIEEIFISKKDDYLIELGKVRNHLKKGLNPVNEQTMRSFLA